MLYQLSYRGLKRVCTQACICVSNVYLCIVVVCIYKHACHTSIQGALNRPGNPFKSTTPQVESLGQFVYLSQCVLGHCADCCLLAYGPKPPAPVAPGPTLLRRYGEVAITLASRPSSLVSVTQLVCRACESPTSADLRSAYTPPSPYIIHM